MGVNGVAVKRTQSVQIQPSPDIENHTLQVLMNLQRRIPKDLKSFCTQPRGAPFIMLLLVWQGVNIAINLNDEVAGENDKVGHIWPDWRLAPNVDTVGLQLS
jgi:hypothetical protein